MSNGEQPASLSERIQNRGFVLDASPEELERAARLSVARSGSRVVVGPVFVKIQATETVDREDPVCFSKEHDELFAQARAVDENAEETDRPKIFASLHRSIMLMIVEALTLAAQSLDGDIDQIDRCTRVDLQVAADDDFKSRLVFERLARNCFRLLFSEDKFPVFNTVFVRGLSRPATISAVFDFEAVGND